MSYADNIRSFLSQAQPSDWEVGTTWYADVRSWAVFQARRFNVLPSQVCQVIAALSPRLSWGDNLHDARVVLAAANTTTCDEYDLDTRAFRRNVAKALDIARGQDVLDGPKVSAFQDNILNPHSTCVTVDVWMIRVCEGDLTLEAKGLTPDQYAAYEDAIKAVADDCGIAPYALQATLWTIARRLADLGGNNKPKSHKVEQLALAF